MCHQPPSDSSRQVTVPHPSIVAIRKALAARPPAPLERVLAQAAASRRFISRLETQDRLAFSATHGTASPEH